MKKLSLYTLLLGISLNSTAELLNAQDAHLLTHNNNRLFFNPSLAGTNGAQTFKAVAKSQWYRDGGNGYKTIGLTYEETVPCSILDGAFKITANEEGKGLYRTVELGPVIAASLTQLSKKMHDHNIRFGADLAFGFNSIDYNRLIWSDQLDPKEDKPVRPTSFVPPNGGRSAWYFNPGFGISWRSLWNKDRKKAIASNLGLACYRFITINDDLTNQSISVLGLRNPNELRITAMAEIEFIPYYSGRKFLSARPAIYFQKQGPIDYVEIGIKTGYSRKMQLNLFYHTTLNSSLGSTRWLTLGTDLLLTTGNGKRIELNLSMAQNIGGLQNFTGPQMEIGIAYHLARSSVCKALKLEDDVSYGNEYKCPILAQTPGKRKMYENIWYKN